jgi:hypothetical protein
MRISTGVLRKALYNQSRGEFTISIANKAAKISRIPPAESCFMKSCNHSETTSVGLFLVFMARRFS